MKKLILILVLGGFFLNGCADEDKKDIQSLNKSLDTKQITGGSFVDASDEIASIVALLFNKKGGLCTGTIIAEDLLLTAAHCIGPKASDMLVIFEIDAHAANGRPVYRQVTASAVPAMYAQQKNQILDHGDIALVHFSGGLPAGYTTGKFLQTPLNDGDQIVLAGYGMTDHWTQAGSGILRKTDTVVGQANFSKTEILIDQRRGKGACKGDSGGPAFVVSNNQHYVFGVTSRGFDRQQYNCPRIAAYTSIQAHWTWIVEEAAKLTTASHLGQFRWN